MDLLLKRLWNYVARDTVPSFQVRLFRLVCLLTSMVCLFVVFPANLFLPSIPMLVNVGNILLGSFAIFCFTESRRGRNRLGLFLAVLTGLLNPIWFLNGGLAGSISFYFFPVSIIPLVFWRGRQRWIISSLILANLCLLMVVGYYYPALTTPFQTPAEQLLDLLTGLFCSFVAMALVIWVIMTNHDWEQTRLSQAGQELAASEEKFSKAFQFSPNGIAISEMATGRFIEVNESFCRLCGYAPAEVLGRTSLEMGIWENAEERDRMLGPLFQGGSVREAELRKPTGTGEARVFLYSAEVVELSGKRCVISQIQDITERKRADEEIRRLLAEARQAEEALRENSDKLLLAMDIARLAPWEFEPAKGQFNFDDNFYRLFGTSAAEEGGVYSLPAAEYLRRFVHPDDAAIVANEIAKAVAGQQGEGTQQIEQRILRKDGSEGVILSRYLVVKDAAGHVVKGYGINQDITEQRQILAEQARLATVVRQSSEIIVICDTQGVINYVNPAFEKTTGYTRAEVLGQTPRILKSGKQDRAFYRRLWGTLKRGEEWHGRFTNRRKDGTLYEEETTISPVRDGVGQIINYVAVKRDITREVQLEADLRQSQKMDAIGQLAGGVAHDFNNILSALLMQAELIGLIESLPPEAREGLKQIRADTQRAADLTRQLLLFSRRQVMQSRLLDLNDAVMNVSKMLKRIIREDVALQLNLHAAPLMTRADAGMLDQVLMNLAVNARDAMTGGGRLQIDTRPATVDQALAERNADARPGPYVCLRVGDTGGGIAPDILPRIFEPFFTTKEAGKGTGLGLATVFGIVKQHQGWIRVDNAPGVGVTFEIFLPASTEAAGEEAPAEAPPKPRGGAEVVLLVEDEAAVLRLTRSILERHGYTVWAASNGVEALQLWRTRRDSVGLLLTDLVMPGGLSGQELARKLQADAPGLKVIFVSGYSAEIAGQDFQLRPGEAFVQKPFAADYLLATIRRCLDS